jgi:hypothetical protein
LLGFVESVYLVYKEYGLLAREAGFFRAFHDAAYFFDAARDGAEVHKFGFGSMCDNTREGSLACARRTPEYHGRESVALYESAENFAFTEQMALAKVAV